MALERSELLNTVEFDERDPQTHAATERLRIILEGRLFHFIQFADDFGKAAEFKQLIIPRYLRLISKAGDYKELCELRDALDKKLRRLDRHFD